ncbi:MAG: hypothetical protein IJJ00_02910 [Erysipelotrichaceae bacterium]|nr:hypothetical protein [Erysipelotrichaceae bacterium]
MNFEIERSRTEKKSAQERAGELFGNKIKGSADALYTDASRERIIAFSGLEYQMPVCMHIINDPLVYDFIKGTDKDLLFIKEEGYRLNDGNGYIELPEEIEKRISDICDTALISSGSLNEKGELELDLKSYRVGSHYGVNLLLGDRSGYDDCLQATPKSVLDELGRGSFRGKQEKQVLATRYVLSPEENGEPANRQFYLTENGRQIFYSLDTDHNVVSAKCLHSQNRTVITYVTECGLEIKRTIFLLPQEKDMPDAVEVQRIEIKNLKDEPRDLRIVLTGMFGITDPATLAGDIIYANVVVESELYCRDGKPLAMCPHHQPKECDGEKRFAMLLCEGEGMDEYCSSLYDFIGKGSLDRPEMLLQLSNKHSRRQAAFFAMAKSFCLEKETVIDSFAGMSDKEDDVREAFDMQLNNLYEKYKDKDKLTATLNRMIEDNDRYYSFITVNSGEPLKDAYLSKNLPFQVLYQTYVSRSFAWTQKSYRETGFREIQDIFASMYYMHGNDQDDLIKRLLASWIENVFELGYAYHNFTTRGKEPGMCSDDQLWLLQAVYRYVKLTGDYDFLKQEFRIAGSDKKRPLYKTLESIIVYSGKISVGRHHLPLLDKADWNDCLRLDKDTLEGPEKEEAYHKQLKENRQEFGSDWDNKQSESVMNACLLKIAADELKEMAEGLGFKDIEETCDFVSKRVCDSLQENAWKKDYFARCLINDGRGYSYLGSTGDGLSLDEKIDGTYYLNSFSWPLLADIATDEETKSMLDIIDKYLKTPAGLKLVTPVDYDKLGIVTGSSFYFPGDRENGGVFKHAAMMCVVACLKKAKTTRDEKLAERLKELAFFMIDKTLPYKTLEDPYVLKGNPRFCTQYNNSQTGEGIGPILSGTASWLTLAMYEILGFEIKGDKISFDPIISEDELNYALNIKDSRIEVHIITGGKLRCDENSTYEYDGQKCGNTISVPNDNKTHKMEIRL